MNSALRLNIFITFAFVVVLAQRPAKPQNKPQVSAQKPKPDGQQNAKIPKIDWGKCPELEPTQTDAEKKLKVRDICLRAHPMPKQLNERTVVAHNKLMIECGLKQENWFDKRGKYRFSRTKQRLTARKLQKPIETKLVDQVGKCRSDAEKKFPNKTQQIESIQLFQQCMDFHTTKFCEIKITQS